MQKEIAALIESMTKKRDELDAAIGALSRVRVVKKRRVIAAPPHRRSASVSRVSDGRPSIARSSWRRWAARKAKANGSVAGEGLMPIPEPPTA